jgi:hypothetical protein
LLELLSEHPVADPSSMGFPEGWKKLPIAGAIGK